MNCDEEEDSTTLTPDFFSDIHKSDFVSVPINIGKGDEVDQCSSFIDYNENIFKSNKDRQRDAIFKYEDLNLKIVGEDAKSNIRLQQKRRNTLSRDRVPTRKGLSRVRRKRFNVFAQNNQGQNSVDAYEPVKIYDSSTGFSNMYA